MDNWTDHMIVRTRPEIEKYPHEGATYWISNAVWGIRKVRFIRIEGKHAVCESNTVRILLRLSETTFYHEQPR